MAVGGLGHIAVLIGNDQDGWRYYSKNGTKIHGLYGESYLPNDGTGKDDFRGSGLNAIQVMRIVNKKYMEDHSDGGERYDNFMRIETTSQQDNLAAEAAYTQVHSYYSVAPKYIATDKMFFQDWDDCAGSCLDVGQDALRATGKKFKYFNDWHVLPNRWFINFGWNNNNRSYNLVPRPLIPSVETPELRIIKVGD